MDYCKSESVYLKFIGRDLLMANRKDGEMSNVSYVKEKKIIRVQVGILILNLILKKTHRKYYSDSIRPAFFSRNCKIEQT